MARLTLRVPDSLHAQLAERAKQEGVSMNQYIVFALSRITAADEIGDQKAIFDAMLRRFSSRKAEQTLQETLSRRNEK